MFPFKLIIAFYFFFCCFFINAQEKKETNQEIAAEESKKGDNKEKNDDKEKIKIKNEKKNQEKQKIKNNDTKKRQLKNKQEKKDRQEIEDDKKKIDFIKTLDTPEQLQNIDLSQKEQKNLFENNIIRQTEIVLFISVPLVVLWNNSIILNSMQSFSSLSATSQKEKVITANNFRYNNDDTLVNSIHPFYLFSLVNTLVWSLVISFDFFQTYNNPENKDIFRITSNKDYNEIFYQANIFRYRF